MSRQAKRMAESLTEVATRRGFLGRMARVATGAAAGMAGLLSAGSICEAAREKRLCYYVCSNLTTISKWVPVNRPCPSHWKGCAHY